MKIQVPNYVTQNPYFFALLGGPGPKTVQKWGPNRIFEVTFSTLLLPIRLALRHIRLALRSIRLALPKKEPTASKMTPKWSPNGALVGIRKTLRRLHKNSF